MDLGAVVLARKVETGWLGVTRKGEFLLRKFVVISLGCLLRSSAASAGYPECKKFAERALTLIFAWDKCVQDRSSRHKGDVKFSGCSDVGGGLSCLSC
jgi:hypothetical protein